MKKLHFGCGKEILEGYVNVDLQTGKGIDKSFDFDKFPYPIPSNTYDEVYSANVLEHLEDVTKVMNELWRVCKDGAIIYLNIPYYNHYISYSDITHKQFFNERSIEVLCEKSHTYKHKETGNLELLSLKKTSGKYRSLIPNWIREILNKFLINTYMNMDIKIQVHKEKKE